jgi:hypothetical protein
MEDDMKSPGCVFAKESGHFLALVIVSHASIYFNGTPFATALEAVDYARSAILDGSYHEWHQHKFKKELT